MAPDPSPPPPERPDRAAVEPPPADAARARRFPWRRLALLAALIGGIYAIAYAIGVTDDFTIDGLRAEVAEAGPLGAVVFMLCFVVGNLIHLPGMLFVVAALLAWGRTDGALIALAAGLVACTTSFVIVRAVGGTPLAEPRHPWARRVLAHLDRRPIPVIAALRIGFQFSPPVNYALAMSSVRLRDYVLGSALGLVPFMFGVAILFEQVITWFG